VSSYLSPGVYIEEVASGPQPIAAAPTSVLAIVGSTMKGPYMTPTRLSGWADFIRTFAASPEGGFTADAVYGYFENGGPAVYVVRVDPSTSAQWTARDGAGNTAFLVNALSPGAWANDVDVVVAPDLTGGSGQTYLANVKTAVKLQAAAKDVDVSSIQGIEAGDTVIVVGTAGTTNAVVNAKGAGTIKLTKTTGGDFDLALGDVIATRADPADTTVRLAAANGFKVGDILLAEQPDRTRRTAVVTKVESGPAGTLLTLQAGGFGSLVPGAQFADRTRRFRGQLTPAGPNVPLSLITWSEPAGLEPAIDDIPSNSFRAFAANGLQGQWNANRFEFGTSAPPKGPIEVEAVVKVHLFTEQIQLTNPTPDALATQYSFIPLGTDLVLSDGTNSATLTRTATGFSAVGSLNRTFTTATSKLPDQASKGVVVRCVMAPAKGDYVQFGANLMKIDSVTTPGGSTYVLAFAAPTDLSGVAGAKFALRGFQATRFQPFRFKLALTGADDSMLEEYRNLALDPKHPQYYFKDGIINKVSTRITVGERPAAAGAISETTMPATVARTQSGANVTAQAADYRAGFEKLEAETEPAMVICPDALTLDDPLLQMSVIGSMVSHAERFRRYSIVDAPNISSDQELVSWRNATVDSTYAGVFAPHVKIVNLDPGAVDRFRVVPPSGFIAGVFARTDRERGVHKAPGNERVRGIVGLAETYTTGRQDLLNPVGVNLIRAFPLRGTRLWGARNATDDTTWRYVNVRRLFNMIETSVERGTQWVVFEPNTRSTWLRVKVSMENFLDERWRAGALAGASAAEAYRVRVGLGETMSESEVDLGLIVIEVAIAPAKPAEFVVFRFSHKRLAE
jgi:phage tail sheath protein FI